MNEALSPPGSAWPWSSPGRHSPPSSPGSSPAMAAFLQGGRRLSGQLHNIINQHQQHGFDLSENAPIPTLQGSPVKLSFNYDLVRKVQMSSAGVSSRSENNGAQKKLYSSELKSSNPEGSPVDKDVKIVQRKMSKKLHSKIPDNDIMRKSEITKLTSVPDSTLPSHILAEKFQNLALQTTSPLAQPITAISDNMTLDELKMSNAKQLQQIHSLLVHLIHLVTVTNNLQWKKLQAQISQHRTLIRDVQARQSSQQKHVACLQKSISQLTLERDAARARNDRLVATVAGQRAALATALEETRHLLQQHSDVMAAQHAILQRDRASQRSSVKLLDMMLMMWLLRTLHVPVSRAMYRFMNTLMSHWQYKGKHRDRLRDGLQVLSMLQSIWLVSLAADKLRPSTRLWQSIQWLKKKMWAPSSPARSTERSSSESSTESGYLSSEPNKTHMLTEITHKSETTCQSKTNNTDSQETVRKTYWKPNL